MKDNSSNNKEILFKSLGHIEVIITTTQNIDSYKNFSNNPTVLDICLLHIGQIGELCKRFSDEFKNKYNNIDFRAIAGLRNIVVHDYSGINYNEIFNTIKNDIPLLKNTYTNILLNDYKIEKDELEKFLNNYINYRKF